MLRGLLGLGGAILAYAVWPVMGGAWQAQKADPVVSLLRDGKPVAAAAMTAAIAALDRAIAADPVAGLHLRRSELLVAAALAPNVDMPVDQRVALLRRAQADLDAGLGGAPARGVAWARLASVRQGLEGTSRRVVDALMMSIETAPLIGVLWPPRLQLILDNWVAFTAEERQSLATYVTRTWRIDRDKRWYAQVIRSPVDELLVRYLLRDEPKAQEELTQILVRAGKKK